MIIAIVRHGTTTWNDLGKIQGQADPPLNAKGIEIAKELGKAMKDELVSYKAIFSSYRKRAKMTAELIRGKSKKTIFYDKLLNSRDLGAFSGLTLDEVKEKFPDDYLKWINWNPRFCPPEGESTKELVNRCKEFIQFLKDTFPEDARILIITHRENLALLGHEITGKWISDPLRTIKNCVVYRYKLDK